MRRSTNSPGRSFWLLGMLETVKLGRADTNGTLGLLEVVVPPGHGSPWHVHPEEDEWVYVLEGQLAALRAPPGAAPAPAKPYKATAVALGKP